MHYTHPLSCPPGPKKRKGNSKNDIGLKVWTTYSLEDTALSSRLFCP